MNSHIESIEPETSFNHDFKSLTMLIGHEAYNCVQTLPTDKNVSS
jgi:hypothetical protein